MSKAHRSARKHTPQRRPPTTKPRVTLIEEETSPDPKYANVQESEREQNDEEDEKKPVMENPLNRER